MQYSTVKTAGGYTADEVISALQKEIRRGKSEEAAYWAYELMISNLETKLWERLTVISVEDIGMADPQACLIIKTLRDFYFELPAGRSDRYRNGLMAAVYLAQAPKDRHLDELYHCLRTGCLEQREIPDYALDKHTARGRALQRGETHFWNDGADLAGEIKSKNSRYFELLKKKLGITQQVPEQKTGNPL